MTTTEHDDLVTAWETWHAERERVLAEPHGWLSLTGLYWLDDRTRWIGDLPGMWRATGDGAAELTVSPGDALVVGGRVVFGEVEVTPVDGKPGEIVEAGQRHIEVLRREQHVALRVRDPRAAARQAFDGVPAFPVDRRWVVEGRFTAQEPRRIDVDTVIDGLAFHPTAVGTVAFTLEGVEQELTALEHPEGLTLHFRDATSGHDTYGGGRLVRTAAPDAQGRLEIDFNRTVNLPCAFTAFATCPLPPDGNVVGVAVEAGEKLPR